MLAQLKKWNLLMAVLFCLSGTAVIAQDEEDSKEEKEKAEEVAVEMVVTASRRAEKKLEAPATIETLSEEEMQYSSATTYVGAIANLKGVDFSNGGLNLQRVSARGFSTSYNSRMLTMTDGRLATLPGAGIPQGTLAPTVGLDIKGIEVVLGPASALYGANASAGVLNVITKNPWDDESISTSARVGEQSLVDFQFRYANVLNDNWGIKLTGQVMRGDDFDSENIYYASGNNQTNATQADIDSGVSWREDELADFGVATDKYEIGLYYKNDDWLASLNYGWSETDSFGTTNLGRNRLDGWGVDYINLIASNDNWYFQYTKTDNSAGKTYGIQNVPPFLAAGLPFETVISDGSLALIIDESSLEDAELQYFNSWGSLEVTAGISWRNYEPVSQGTYLDDFPGVSIKREEEGAYLQLDYRMLDDKLRLTGAVRRDSSDEYETQTSPKLSVTYTEGNQTFRLGYNEAHRDPSILENHLYFAAGVAQGNQFGWTITGVQTDGTTGTRTFPSIAPETVQTIELGYRGVIGGNVIIDGVVYSSEYESFISPLQLISFGNGLATAVNGAGRVWEGPLLTYLNYGQAEVEGFDIGIDYFYEDSFRFNFSYGFQELKEFTNNTAIPDLPYNTPENKIKAGITWTNWYKDGTFLTLSGRNVEEHPYNSGRWIGVIGDYTIFDFASGYHWKENDLIFKLSASNLFEEDKTELIGVPALPRFVAFEVTKKW